MNEEFPRRKALGKGYAIKNSTAIIQKVGSVLSGFRIK